MKIRANDLVKEYGGRIVVDHVSLEVAQGSIVGLLGKNGAGKTTTFYMIVGLEHPDRGTVHLDELEVTHLPMYKRALAGIGYLPQEASIFRKLTVEENLLAILEDVEPDGKKRQEKMEALIEEFHIGHIRKSLGTALSGGERRRVEIARALATEPKLLLLDEPAAGMNPNETKELMETISFVRDHFNMTILLIEHDMKLVSGICEELTVLNFGKVLAQGPTAEVLNDPQVITAYLGE